MSEQKNEFEQMLDESIRQIHQGEIVKGKVISVKEDEAVLNIGYKSDGILPKNEYSSSVTDLTEVLHEGDELEVKVVKVNDGDGQVSLTYRRLAQERMNRRIEEAFEKQEVLTAPVTQIMNGGICATFEGAKVFIPASLVSDRFERDLNKYMGKEVSFVIIECNPKRRRIIGDCKQVIIKEKTEKKEALFARIAVGDVVEGTVKNVTDFGAFVDLGGADGLLHISEMSWGRVDNPRKVFHSGDHVKAFIKDINGEKIALSLKFPEENPWTNASEKYAAGTIVTGKVARMTDFGAFIELAPGVDALLHVSQISREHVARPSDVLSVGEEVEAKIVDFNEADHKISLSMKDLQPYDDDDDYVDA
ncbi:MAG: 30S ribosomal protein S1 [Lachnospiraceae bacterium]|nr:30S ribosomal protein S1 [Lachnospiraceae bacterium]